MEPTDPRIVALYDIDNPDGPDHDHWRRLTDAVDPHTIVDLGCGTGIITVTLAGSGRHIVGIDPDAGMLDFAQNRRGGENVTWIVGDSGAIGDACADLVLMTGTVVQQIGPDTWHSSLRDIACGLTKSGVVGFENRNPAAEAWRSWTRDQTLGRRETPNGLSPSGSTSLNLTPLAR